MTTLSQKEPAGNGLRTFSFEGKHPIRTTLGEGVEPRWVAKDVARALGYARGSNPAKLFSHVPQEWRGVNRIHTPSGEQDMLTISEAGLFFFLGRSDKPAALPMQKWVAGEVLPSIRRTGAYSVVPPSGNWEVASDLISHAVTDALGSHPTWEQPLAEKIEQTRRCSKGTYELTKKMVSLLEGRPPALLGEMTAGEAARLLNSVRGVVSDRRDRQEAAHRLLPMLIPAPRPKQDVIERPLPGMGE